MSKTSRLYKDSRTAPSPPPRDPTASTSATSSTTASSTGLSGPAGNLGRINDDLQDVTRIMTKNMEDLLWRGDSLDSESRRSIRLDVFPRRSKLQLQLGLSQAGLLSRYFTLSVQEEPISNSVWSLLLSSPPRDVPPLDLAPFGIAQVQETSEEHQPRSHAEAVRTCGSRGVDHCHLLVVEVLLI